MLKLFPICDWSVCMTVLSVDRWFCHVDDDNYVNVPRLARLLGTLNYQQDWYLGKPSIRAPLEILDRESKARSKVRFCDCLSVVESEFRIATFLGWAARRGAQGRL